MSWLIALGAACLATVIVSEVVGTARRRCPACGRGGFHQRTMQCQQGFIDVGGDAVRVGGVRCEYRCKHCGAERVQFGRGPYLTREELAAIGNDPEAIARMWGLGTPPKATVVPPRT